RADDGGHHRHGQVFCDFRLAQKRQHIGELQIHERHRQNPFYQLFGIRLSFSSHGSYHFPSKSCSRCSWFCSMASCISLWLHTRLCASDSSPSISSTCSARESMRSVRRVTALVRGTTVFTTVMIKPASAISAATISHVISITPFQLFH